MLIANGENVKVVQERMRHSNCRCTLEIYSQARLQAKRDAQHRLIVMIVPQEREATGANESLILATARPPGCDCQNLYYHNSAAHQTGGDELAHWSIQQVSH